MTRRRPKINPATRLAVSGISLREIDRLRKWIVEQAAPVGAKVKGPCWRWSGYTDGKGYGQASFRGKTVWVHRLMYAIFRASIPDAMQIDHRCKNPSCCNPSHLKRTTQARNCADISRQKDVVTAGNYDPERW